MREYISCCRPHTRWSRLGSLRQVSGGAEVHGCLPRRSITRNRSISAFRMDSPHQIIMSSCPGRYQKSGPRNVARATPSPRAQRNRRLQRRHSCHSLFVKKPVTALQLIAGYRPTLSGAAKPKRRVRRVSGQAEDTLQQPVFRTHINVLVLM